MENIRKVEGRSNTTSVFNKRGFNMASNMMSNMSTAMLEVTYKNALECRRIPKLFLLCDPHLVSLVDLFSFLL